MRSKDYIAIVQCHIVKERCSGFYCEKAFHDRSGGFTAYPRDREYRTLYLTCGGCCGRALHRKLSNLISQAKKSAGIDKDQIIVQLSSCITKDNYHAPPCPHSDYLKQLIAKLGLDFAEDTKISKTAEKRRTEGFYKA